jgi:hypothetical protein
MALRLRMVKTEDDAQTVRRPSRFSPLRHALKISPADKQIILIHGLPPSLH